MSIDSSVTEPPIEKYDFWGKPIRPSFLSRIIPVGAVGFALLGPVAVTYSGMLENPPQVIVTSGRVDVQPHTYSGDYLTKFSDGSMTMETIGGLFSPDGPYITIRANRLGLVYNVEGNSIGRHKRGEQLSPDSEQVFADAQAKLDEVIARYKPYMTAFTF